MVMWVVHGHLAGLDPGKWEELLADCSLFTERVERGEGPEFFLDLTRLPEPEAAVGELRKLLVPRLGERFLASLAGNKLVARAATLAQRAGLVRGEDGVVVVPPGKEADFLAPLPLAYLWPVEPRLRERLRLLGLKTIGQVAELAAEELYRFFGPEGYRVAQLSRGRDGSRVEGTRLAYLKYRSPWEGEADRERLMAWCAAAAVYLAREEERCRSWGRRLELIFFPEDGLPLIRKREFNRPLLTAGDLRAALERLLPTALSGRLNAVAARLGPLVPLLLGQLSLTFVGLPRERERLEKVLARLEERYPGRINWGGRWPASRRERMLAFFDPLRRWEKSEGEENHAAG
ncbi:MAG: polymerase [Bacillota bacterium]|nr:polymerase [Bacillota bacterium]